MAATTTPATQTAASTARGRTLAATAPLWAGAALLLAAPFFTAFRSGGYGVQSQLLVGGAALALLAVVAVTAPWPPLPRGLPLVALAALVGYGVWTGLSTGWARVVDSAAHDTYRVGMYCAAFALALAVMRLPAIRRLAPEVLLTGVLVVCLYSLAGRILPHLVHEKVNAVRLSQPLTYWNSLGMFAGLGVLLGVAVAGDKTRAPLLRALACAAAVPCGLAVYLTLSRGAAAAVVAGLILCVVIPRSRSNLLAALCAVVPVVALAFVVGAFPQVQSIHRHAPDQASQGAQFLPFAVAATVAAGLAYARLSRSRIGRGRLLMRRRTRAVVAIGTVPLVLALGIAIAGHGKEKTQIPATASRFIRAETNRGHYWRVSLDAFRRHPLNGVGSGSFAVEWSRQRGSDQPALDAHSLYIETLGELGIVGAAFLLAFIVTVAVGTARAARAAPRDATVVAGASALAAFAVHAGLDWDWEMPAVSLIPLVLAAAVLRSRMDA